MLPRLLSALFLLYGICVAPLSARAQFANFEAQQTRPICLSPDGTRLFAVNTADGRVSVFDVSNPANPAPVLIREIPVGIEPVSVNALSNDEAWVVNEVGDSVSVVSVPLGVTTDTLAAKDEPGDVVFAGGQAFVSCSRNNLLRVFDTTTHAQLGTIALQGLNPHSLAVSNDGTKVYAAFKLSGNKTTLLPPSPMRMQPPPTNPLLPAPPIVGEIVLSNDSRLSTKPNMPDNDVAEITAATRTVARYFSGVGTINFAIKARPGSSELWVANTEARNLVRFEPVLKGHLVDNRVTRIHTGTSVVTPFDLNPGIDYGMLPNNAAKATALAQPTDLAFEPDGAHFWVASFGTDRVARVNANTGLVATPIETGPTTGSAADPRNKRGPRGLAYQAATGRLYALNRLSNTITVVASGAVATEIPVGSYDPTPAVIREGRGFLYDARLSGNGTQSCATCHIDGDRDDLAWDLGDPGGNMAQVSQPNPPPLPPGTQTFNFHPMKGPMTTQTLRGITGTEPLHWRADRASFMSFNGAFESLLGGSMLIPGDMSAFANFINTVLFEPNPNQNLDRTLPSSFAGGNANTGRTTYLNTQYQTGLTCNTCHSLPNGTNRLIIPAAALQVSQDFKVPQLRNVYQKLHFVRSATIPSLSGFGLVHDGMDPDVTTFLSRPVFGTFATNTTIKANLNAFVQCLDTGTAPATGYDRTVRAANLATSGTDWSLLEAQAIAENVDFVLRGVFFGKRHGFLYRPETNDYVSDEIGLGPLTRLDLQNAITAGQATLTLLGVLPGSGPRLSTDRNANGIPDASESLPKLALTFPGGTPQLAWSAAQSALVLEYTDTLTPPDWRPVVAPRFPGGASVLVPDPAAGTQRFYRLRVP